jgi:hypothetical protein
MVWIVQLSMNARLLLLVCLVCIAAVPAVIADSNYMGGDIVLGGSGPRITITEVTPTVVQTTAKVPVQAVQETGSIMVESTPKGASITIDGTLRGVAPAIIPGLSAGSHTLLLKLDGYQDFSGPVTVTSGETRNYAMVMTPVAGAAAATPAPAGKKTPGFGAVLGIAALGAVFLLSKNSR